MLSAISNSNSSTLAQWLGSIKKQQASQLAGGSSVVQTSAQPGATPTTSQLVGGHGGHHAGGVAPSGASQLFAQIRQTVSTALQKAQISGSSENPNEIVQDSITSLLKNLGFGSNSSAASTLAAAESNDQGPEESSSPNFTEGFQKVLNSAGITPQQFKSDVMAAVQNVQNASNPTYGSLSAPTRSMLDVTG